MQSSDIEEDFREIFMDFYPRLKAFALSIIKQDTLAEEIVDDVFIKLWGNVSNLSAIKNIRFYLYVSTKNQCINYIAKNKKIPLEYIDCHEIDLGPISVSPEDCVISSENLLLIQNAVQKLPSKCKLIFLLIKEEGLKYSEVAELLHISIKTVETQMSIAFKKLLIAMKDDFPGILKKMST